MKKHRLLTLVGLPAGLAIVALGLFALFTARTSASDPVPFVARPLTGASDKEVARVAIAYVRTDVHVRSGTPEVKLVRSVTDDELAALGLPAVNFGSIEKPPMKVVILKGDFDTEGHPQPVLLINQEISAFHYIGYVFDVWAGVPALTMFSGDGARFRTALNDPSLPMPPPSVIVPAAPTTVPSWHYGDIAPTVSPPRRTP